MTTCIFCKIIAKEIPAGIVREDTDFVAFLDIHPHSKGHTLVIPREHHVDLLQLPSPLKEKILTFVQDTAADLYERYQPTGMNIASNVGGSAGQIVFHTHIHLIPRY